MVLRSRHNRLLPNPFQFVIYPEVHLLYGPGHVTCCTANLAAEKSRVNLFEFPTGVRIPEPIHSGMNCLRSLEHLDRGFESHSRYGRLRN
jgi:hypothetical protein